jgi:hypothetical protein
LDSDFILIGTCFLNLLLKFIRTTYPSNLYPIGLPDLTRLTYPNPAQTACPNSTRAPYPIVSILTRPYAFIPSRITLPDPSPDQTSTYPGLHGLTRLNYLTRLFSRSNFYLPDLTRSYPAELPYPISSRSNFCLLDRIRPPYPISLPGRVTPRCTQLLTRPYPITLPGRVPFNWPHPKTSSSASHLDLGLLLADNASR